MSRQKRILLLAGALSLALLLLQTATVSSGEKDAAQQKSAKKEVKPEVDIIKTGVISKPALVNDGVEPPVERVIQTKSAPVIPPEAPKPRVDRGKRAIIERPVVDVVKNTTAPAPAPATQPPLVAQPRPRLDVGKGGFIEPRVQQFVQFGTGGNFGNLGGQFGGAPAAPAAKTDFVNPKVEPGKVKWHKDLETAKAAALKSKKPVLLFQMMGKLDDQFC